jgi:hypothetical protein
MTEPRTVNLLELAIRAASDLYKSLAALRVPDVHAHPIQNDAYLAICDAQDLARRAHTLLRMVVSSGAVIDGDAFLPSRKHTVRRVEFYPTYGLTTFEAAPNGLLRLKDGRLVFKYDDGEEEVVRDMKDRIIRETGNYPCMIVTDAADLNVPPYPEAR